MGADICLQYPLPPACQSIHLATAIRCSALIDCSLEPGAVLHSRLYTPGHPTPAHALASYDLYFSNAGVITGKTILGPRDLYRMKWANFTELWLHFVVSTEYRLSDGPTPSWWVSSLLSPAARAPHSATVRGVRFNKVERLFFSKHFPTPQSTYNPYFNTELLC